MGCYRIGVGISILHFGSIVDNFIGCVPCLMFAFDFAFVFILQLVRIVCTSSVFFRSFSAVPFHFIMTGLQ